jgi:membrane fusion protein (multidrug efflux system)
VGRVLGTGVQVKTSTVTSRKYWDMFGAVGDATPSETWMPRKAPGFQGDLAHKVDRVHVKVGDFVKAGDLLIEFDSAALDSRIKANEESQALATRNLEELDKRQAFRRKEMKAAVRSAEAHLQSARSTLARDEENLKRMQELWNEQLVSKFDLERARAARDLASFNLRSAEEELLKRRNNQRDLEADLANQRNSLLADLSTAEAHLHASTGDREVAWLRAPWDGLVTDISAGEGEWQFSGENLIRLAQIDSIHVSARVAQEMVDRVFLGQQAEVVFDALPYQTWEGEVINVDPAVDKGSATFKTTISVSNTDRRIRPGMSGFARFRNERIALVIPQPAITGTGSDTAVFVVEEKVAKLRHVQIGEVVNVGFVEVMGGMKEGETVVVHGLKDLQDGDPVRIVGE